MATKTQNSKVNNSSFSFGGIDAKSTKKSILSNDKSLDVSNSDNVEETYTIIPESERVKIYDVTGVTGYDDFNEELYPNSLNFYDFEVFRYDWCITIINPIEKKRVIIVNSSKKLKEYYESHKEQIWVGYNSRNYDTFILKSILLDMNPKQINDDLIVREKKGWQISKDFNNIKLLDFDLFNKNGSLKLLEGFMGNDIRETEVDFNLDRLLNKEEILQTIKYNIHDVEQTIEVFRLSINNFNSHIQLIDTFNLNKSSISMTQAQLTARILECEPPTTPREDEFDFDILPVIQLNKYKKALDWFKNPENKTYKSTFDMEVCGVPHQFGWGGLHGAPEEPVHYTGNIYHVDVNSYYPSIMIVHDLLTRNCKHKEKYKEIYDYRLKLKHEGKKKEQAPYKIVLNSTYGICKDKYSLAYDPNRANSICVNGQLMLVDLLEHLEPYINLIQSNTDGIILQIKNEEDTETVLNICHEWENRTGMGLEIDEILEIFQKDVNNYVVSFGSQKDIDELINKLKEFYPNVHKINDKIIFN